MLIIKYWIIPIAALVPMIIGFIWYHPKVLGTLWMRETGLTEEKLNSGNMAVIMGVSYLFACFLALTMIILTVHQMGFQSMLVNEPGFGEEGSAITGFINDTFAKYGSNFRTFKHGAFHGVLTGLTFALPLIAINSLFERKSWKYIWIHAGYWVITLALMGGIVCQFA